MISKKSIFELATALGGIPVLGALTGSPAAKAGIRYGDVVISVNGLHTPNMIDYVHAKSLRADGMDVVVFRDGVEHSFELVFRAPSHAPDLAALLAEVIGMRLIPGADDGPRRGDPD